MAEEDPYSTNRKKLIDFPPLSLLDSLIQSFPKEWRGVFASLSSEHLPAQAASFWLQSKSANEKVSDISPNWKDFLDHLVRDYPVVLNDKLLFKPKILLFPLNIQINTLAFIGCHCCSVPVESLDKFVHSLRKFAPEFKGWRLSQLKILDSKAKHLKEFERGGTQDREQGNGKVNSFLHTDLITEESKFRLEDLIKKYKLAESSTIIPWFSSVLESDLGGDDYNNANISEQHEPTFKGKNGDQDDIDMNDLTDVCSQDVDVQSEKTLQEFHSTSSYVSVTDSDIEIIKVVKSPAKQVKLEPDTVGMKDLSVPPPPGHFILDNEDVPEQFIINIGYVPENLITSSKDVAEHPITNNENVPEHLILNIKDVSEHLITGEDATTQANLCGALQLKISALQNMLQSSEANELNLSNEFQVFSTCSSQEMECICTQLKLKDIEESLAIWLCQQFVTLSTEPSLSNAAIFAAHCLLPKVQGLKQTASRALFSAVSQFAKKHSRAFCDGVIIRLINQLNLDVPQVDLINKVIKESLSEDTRIHLLQLIFASESNTERHPFLWTESTVSILQTLVDLKPELNGDLFGTLVGMLEQQSRHLQKSLKFAKMLLAVIKTYGQLVSMHLNSFVHILKGNETFLKKAGLSALKKTTTN